MSDHAAARTRHHRSSRRATSSRLSSSAITRYARCAASISKCRAANSSRSPDRLDRASRPSCTSSAASIGRRPANTCSTGRTSRRCRRTSWRRCATGASASSSRDSTCCRARPRSTTSNCRCSTAARRKKTAERHKRAEEMLAAVGLGDRLTHFPNQLLRRPAAARRDRARAHQQSVDPAGGRADRQSGLAHQHRGDGPVSAAQLERGITVVLITHESDIAEYGTRIVSFRDGHIVNDRQVARRRTAADELAQLPRSKRRPCRPCRS